jgi:hypothetical protein
MDLTVESPTVSAKARREFVINFFSNEVKYFDASNHFIRERRPVRSDYWSIIFARFTRRILLPIGLRIPRLFSGLSDACPIGSAPWTGRVAAPTAATPAATTALEKNSRRDIINFVWIWLNFKALILMLGP